MAIPIKAVLSVSTKTFKAGISGASKVLGGFVALTKIATVAVLGLTAGFTALVVRQAGVIDRIGKVSKVTGVAAETLQKFSFAAEQAGVSTDQAQVALRRFSRRLGEAQKNTGELAPTLRRLGIDLRGADGEFKNAEEVLLELSDAIANTEGESARLSIAFKAFDSEGAELVNVLNQGSDAMREMFSRAELLGGVLSTSSIQGVEDFNDAMNELSTLVGGVANSLTAALAPALEELAKELTNFLLELSKEFGGVENLGEALALSLLDSVEVIIRAFGSLSESIVNFMNQVRDFGKITGFTTLTKEAQVLQNVLDDVNTQVNKLDGSADQGLDNLISKFALLEVVNKTLQRLFKQTDKELLGSAEQGQSFIANMFVLETRLAALVEQRNNGIDATAKSLLGLNYFYEENMNILIDILEKNRDNLDVIEFEGVALANILDLIQRMRTAILENNDAQETGKKVVEETVTFYERIVAFLEKAGPLMKAFMDDSVQFGEIFERVAERLGTPIERLQKTLEDGLVKGVEIFEDTLTDAILKGKADFSSLGDHIKQVLAKALVQKFFTGPILAAFGLASGGPAKAGQPYIVGEEGPELFVPRNSGTVIPNDETMAMAGGQGLGGSSQVTYNINAVDARSFKELVAQDPEYLYNVTQVGARRQPR